MGYHHFAIRKRIYNKFQNFPHDNKTIARLDNIIMVVAVMGVGLTIPQAVKIWSEKSATGLSLTTWVAYLFASLFWFTYGYLHKEKVIFVSNIFAAILNVFIVVGILMYGAK